MNSTIENALSTLVGKRCWRKEIVGKMKSLNLGFGSKVHVKTKRMDKFYGEWEIGTYYCAWRIIKGNRVICGSGDTSSIEQLNARLDGMELGRFASMTQPTDLDLRVNFDSGLAVDFFATISDDDECFHVFCPNNQYVVFSVAKGWEIGPSSPVDAE